MIKMKYLLMLVISITINYQLIGQTTGTVSLICYRDFNNNGLKEATEPILNNRFTFFIGDTITNASEIHVCNGAGVYTVSTINNLFRIYSEYNMHSFSAFWTSTKEITGSTQLALKSSLLPFNNTYYVPIPIGFGESYLPITGLFSHNATNNCLADSSSIIVKLGYYPWDTTCTASNTYSYDCFTGFIAELKVNNSVVDTYTINNCYTPIVIGNWSFYTFSNNTLYLKQHNSILIPGQNIVKISISGANGYTLASVYTFTFNNNYPYQCGQFKVKSFVDCNQNCIKDNGELFGNHNNSNNIVLTGSPGTYTIYGNSNGNFNSSVPNGTYAVFVNPTIQCNSLPSVITIPSNTTYILPLATNTMPVNFNTINYICCGSPGPGAVPGGTFTSFAQFNSNFQSFCPSTNSISVTCKLVLPKDMYYMGVLNTTPLPSTVIITPLQDTVVWNINNPAQTFIFQSAIGVYTTAVIGNYYDIISIVATSSDTYTLDNFYTFNFDYGGPYDPNNKTSYNTNVLNNGYIPFPVNDAKLKYTVNFQNLGNGPALNVSIRDTIDPNLDLKSLRIINSSYPVILQINTSSREALFNFNTINLPPGTLNDYTNRGFVTFSVNMSGTPLIGNNYKNKAYIYFDYNSPIITNETNNTIIDVQKTNEYSLEEDHGVFPNPSNNEIFIKLNSTETINYTIIDSFGKVCKIGTLKPHDSIDISQLSQGLYLLTFILENQKIINEKFIKK